MEMNITVLMSWHSKTGCLYLARKQTFCMVIFHFHASWHFTVKKLWLEEQESVGLSQSEMLGSLDTISSQKQQQQHPQSNDSVKMIAKELSFIVCHVLKTMVACRYHHHGGTCDFVIRTDQGTFEPIFVRHDPYFTPCLPTLVRPFPRVLNVGSKFVFGSSVHPSNPLINCQTGERQIDFVCPICSHATSFVKCFCHVNSCRSFPLPSAAMITQSNESFGSFASAAARLQRRTLNITGCWSGIVCSSWSCVCGHGNLQEMFAEPFASKFADLSICRLKLSQI